MALVFLCSTYCPFYFYNPHLTEEVRELVILPKLLLVGITIMAVNVLCLFLAVLWVGGRITFERNSYRDGV